MPIRFQCPCGKKLKVSRKYAGKKTRCTQCERIIRIPSQTADAPKEDVGSGEAKKEFEGTVVVCDSSGRDQYLTVSMLEDEGFQVFTTEDGQKAIELIRATRPDACLLDLNTEGLGVFQVIKMVQDDLNPENRAVWHTPMYLTGSEISDHDRQFASSLRVRHCYRKPLGAAQVCGEIRECIRRRPPGLREKDGET